MSDQAQLETNKVPTELTREQFYEKYGDVQITFMSYYKYVFTYLGITSEGCTLVCGCGGNSDSIYRHNVQANRLETVRELQPFSAEVTRDGIVVETMNDY